MDLICFSHLRWDFVYQRPQHLLSRFSKIYTTYYVEEYKSSDEEDGFSLHRAEGGVIVVVPHLKVTNGEDNITVNKRVYAILQKLFSERNIDRYFFWYYTPMALPFTHEFHPELLVYDCMDELSAFIFAPPEMHFYEKKLLQIADIVFTGGSSLFKAKTDMHENVHVFPSSIDKEHFQVARFIVQQPADQQYIPHPRLGFFGVIDERLDLELIGEVAESKPDWHIILIGPVVKIDQNLLPRHPNIHYLGSKHYNELPNYISGWDISLIPFALNESTKYISPTKTPEYLAAAKPVISTAIADVVEPYGRLGLVHIVNNANELIEHAEIEFNKKNKSEWLERVDKYLKDFSWDRTWSSMYEFVRSTQLEKHKNQTIKDKMYV